MARYEGVFQNVLNEVHAPDIAHDVYVLQGDIVVPSGTGRKIRSVPTLTRAKPNLPSHFLRASNNRTAPCADEPACCMQDARMRLSLGEPVVALPDFFAKPSNAQQPHHRHTPSQAPSDHAIRAKNARRTMTGRFYFFDGQNSMNCKCGNEVSERRALFHFEHKRQPSIRAPKRKRQTQQAICHS